MARDVEAKKLRGRPRLPRSAQDTGASVQAIDRCIAVLTTVAAADGLTLTDLAHRAGLVPSTAHRILATLEAHRSSFMTSSAGSG